MAGMGLSFLSLRTVRHELATGHLVQLDLAGMPVLRHWHVTHLRAKRLSSAMQVFKQFLLDKAGALIQLWA